ncbi:Vacuolar morphogenesis protein 6, partial [Modicella reniformis]
QDESVSITLQDTLKTFSKKAIEQIDAIKQLGTLVILTDGCVNLHELGTYSLVRTLAKGAYLFSVFSEIQKTSELHVITRLAVAVRRKIIVYSWRNNQPMDTKEFTVADRVRKMEWVTTRSLCIGFDNEYSLVDYESGELKVLCSLSSPLHQGGSTYETTLNTLQNLGSFATGALMGFAAKPGRPLLTRLPKEEILLVKEDSSFSVGLDGKPKWDSGIEWSGTPVELGYAHPYAVAILPRHIEIRNIKTRALVQNEEMPHVRLLIQEEKKSLLIELFLTCAQVDELVQKEDYQEAISLISQVDSVLDVDTGTQVKMLYAHHLFRAHHYEEALMIFKDLDVPATEVIALYPADISGHLTPKDAEGTSSLSFVHNEKNRTSIRHTQSTIMSNDKELKEAVGYLFRFLEEKREWIQQDIRETKKSSTSQDRDDRIQKALKMLEIVDTALLKSYVFAGGPQVGALLRNINYCNLEETETLLLKRKVGGKVLPVFESAMDDHSSLNCNCLIFILPDSYRNRELIDFYKGKGLHRKALEHLKALHDTSEDQVVLQTVYYLQDLDAGHFDLILEFGTWILKIDPIVAMEIFTVERSDTGTLPRNKIISYLEKLSLDLCVMYLEHIIYELHDQTPEFHNHLLISYLAQIQRDSASHENKDSEQAVNKTRKKMLDFLNESTCYKAERILSRLPVDGCYEERAILLSRIGQHDQALNIYVHKLGDNRAAEEYCVKNFDSADSSKNVYLMLLKVYLNPPSPEKPMLDPALGILTRHGTNIDPIAVLRMLPPMTRVDQLYKFFEKSIRESNKTKHMDMIVRNLLKAEQLQTQEQLSFYRSRCVRITEDRMCPKCNKRIGYRPETCRY